MKDRHRQQENMRLLVCSAPFVPCSAPFVPCSSRSIVMAACVWPPADTLTQSTHVLHSHVSPGRRPPRRIAGQDSALPGTLHPRWRSLATAGTRVLSLSTTSGAMTLPIATPASLLSISPASMSRAPPLRLALWLCSAAAGEDTAIPHLLDPARCGLRGHSSSWCPAPPKIPLAMPQCQGGTTKVVSLRCFMMAYGQREATILVRY